MEVLRRGELIKRKARFQTNIVDTKPMVYI